MSQNEVSQLKNRWICRRYLWENRQLLIHVFFITCVGVRKNIDSFRLGVIGIGRPCRLIIFNFISPLVPISSDSTSKEFQKRARTAILYNIIQFIRLSRMLAFLRSYDVNLFPARCKCSQISFYTKKDLCYSIRFPMQPCFCNNLFDGLANP